MVNTAKNVLIMLKNLQQMRLKLLEKVIKKNILEAIGDLIGNEVAEKITRVSKNLQQNNSEIIINEHEERKIYISQRKIKYCW